VSGVPREVRVYADWAGLNGPRLMGQLSMDRVRGKEVFSFEYDGGWTLSPAYDMNPNPQGDGLTLNITENDNRLDLDLALEMAASFHLDMSRAEEMMGAVRRAVKQWRHVATRQKLSKAEQEKMSLAFSRA